MRAIRTTHARQQRFKMKNNPLTKLGSLEQSVWLDYIRRDLITSGELKRLIEEDGLRGMTSNPSIFQEAIAGSHEYDDDIRTMAQAGKGVNEIYEALTQQDVKSAADAFRALYERSEGLDGYVSLEVNPHLAHDTEGTLVEARRLWAALDRPNVLIKVPATAAGLPAIQELITEGINVNVTLLFGLSRYQQVVEAYVGGLKARTSQNKPVANVASVASFFISRIDAMVDPMLEAIAEKDGPESQKARLLHGQVAIASAKAAYKFYKDIYEINRLDQLAGIGARPQRLLWASTSTKNPAYSDVKYVEALIGRDTVNTLPIDTLNDYRDHGDPKERIEDDVALALKALEQLPELGINLETVTQRLEDEGVAKFSKSFDTLIATLQTAVQRCVVHVCLTRMGRTLEPFRNPSMRPMASWS